MAYTRSCMNDARVQETFRLRSEQMHQKQSTINKSQQLEIIARSRHSLLINN